MNRAPLRDRLSASAAWWVYFWGPDAPMKLQDEQERVATVGFLSSACEFFDRHKDAAGG